MKAKQNYPVLGELKGGTCVVLFSAPGIGTVVFDEDDGPRYDIGYYDTDWDMNMFRLFVGEIELQVEAKGDDIVAWSF